jgi:hypothetical protein
MVAVRSGTAALLFVSGAGVAGAQAGDQESVYFEEPPPTWEADWGTDAAFTVSDLEAGSSRAAAGRGAVGGPVGVQPLMDS